RRVRNLVRPPSRPRATGSRDSSRSCATSAAAASKQELTTEHTENTEANKGRVGLRGVKPAENHPAFLSLVRLFPFFLCVSMCFVVNCCTCSTVNPVGRRHFRVVESPDGPRARTRRADHAPPDPRRSGQLPQYQASH